MLPLDANETLRRLANKEAAFIDVRSEGEFAQGHIPGFVNRPILNDHERHVVGLTYKTEGQAKAIETGHRLVAPLKAERIAEWVRLANAHSNRAIVTCWRGGLRSKITVDWLREAGIEALRVQGGYKALRRKLVENFDRLPDFAILTGLTGTGKTKLLTEVPIPKLDLEGLAKHRGSAFGQDLFVPQPSQASFENQMAIELQGHSELLVEDESRRIGMVAIPSSIKDKMMVSPVVILESPIHVRSQFIFDVYIHEPMTRGKTKDEIRDHMASRLDKIQRQLGGALHQDVRKSLLEAFSLDTKFENHQGWIQTLLLRHYDPRYRYAFERQERKILFQGEYFACHQFLVKRSQEKALHQS